jgi:hypothetical protein
MVRTRGGKGLGYDSRNKKMKSTYSAQEEESSFPLEVLDQILAYCEVPALAIVMAVPKLE